MRNIKTIRVLSILTLIVIFSINLFSQNLPDSTIKKIDNLFKTWDNNYSPGCIIGIIRNDSLIYSKGYGMANLEFGAPITTETVFHMASVSKQFTAYSIILLANRGKLKLDDDIHKYLSWFPDLKEKITINNLLNHTSGIRDQWQLMDISGTRYSDIITQEHVVSILSNQKALNFKPGEQYMYSNSGFTLLAEIVKSVTGQTLRQFADSAIFKPLGMTKSFFRDDNSEIIKNRAASYRRLDKTHFANSVFNNSSVGATNLSTTIDDMSKWVSNFYYTKAGNQNDINLLTQKGKLNNGKELNYAAGIVSGTYKGWREFAHAGGDAGYRTYITVFPDLKMGFLVFANVPEVGTSQKAHQLADLFISDTSGLKNPPQKIDSSKAFLKDASIIKKIAGDYIGEDGLQIHFFDMANKFYLSSDAFGDSLLLFQEDQTTFSFIDRTDVRFLFTNSTIKPALTVSYSKNEFFLFTKYKKDEIWADATLKEYTGTYYCPELQCRYDILLKDHHLVIKNIKYPETPVTFAGPNHLFTGLSGMNHLMMIRNKEKVITGFEVNSNRVMHLRFDKTE